MTSKALHKSLSTAQFSGNVGKAWGVADRIEGWIMCCRSLSYLDSHHRCGSWLLCGRHNSINSPSCTLQRQSVERSRGDSGAQKDAINYDRLMYEPRTKRPANESSPSREEKTGHERSAPFVPSFAEGPFRTSRPFPRFITSTLRLCIE